MPDCYFLAIAERSALDQDTNNFSLFGLIEKMRVFPGRVAKSGTPPVAPFQVHVYWKFPPDQLGKAYQWRLVFVGQDGDHPHEKTVEMTSATTRFRYKIDGLPLLVEGDVRIEVEWRPSGEEEWHRCDAYWPIELEILSEPPPNKPN